MLTDPFYVAAIALALSVIASGARLLNWFLHSDSKSIVRTGRWMIVLVALMSVPLLVTLLLNQQWEAAMALGSVMLFSFALFGWRFLRRVTAVNVMLDTSGPFRAPQTAAREAASQQELAWHAASVLEEYLRSTGATPLLPGPPLALPGPRGGRRPAGAQRSGNGAAVDRMTRQEALAVLGLKRNATDADVLTVHRRLALKLRPDRGGSNYLVAKVNEARAVLLGDDPDGISRKSSPKRPRRSPPAKEL